MLITDGYCSDSPTGDARIPAIFEFTGIDELNGVAEGSWEPLCGAKYDNATHPFDLGWYPFMFQTIRNEGVFMAGSHYINMSDNDPTKLASNLKSRMLDINGSPNWWADVASSCDGGTCIKGGSAVTYLRRVNDVLEQHVVKAGGGTIGEQIAACGVSSPTGRAFTIDLSPGVSTPAWTEIATMNHKRIHFYLINLPDGRIMAVGGSGVGTPANPQDVCVYENAQLTPEVYDPFNPGSGWQTLPAMAAPRVYHSAALLLPSGAVIVMGGESSAGLGGDHPQVEAQRTYQIFKPSYFDQTRPGIVSAPTFMRYNRGYDVVTPDAEDITAVRMLRTGAATHSFDQNARSIECKFTYNPANPGKIRVTSPPHGYAAPPGHYMLFICTGANGAVPSVSTMVLMGIGTSGSE